MPRYQHQVEQALPRALSQGRLGWQVTDVKITLTGRIISDVQQMRGEVTDTAADEETVTLKALVPAASSMDYPTQFASVTGGRGSLSTALHGYRECPADPEHTMPRRGVDPLDTARYILAARSALEREIY